MADTKTPETRSANMSKIPEYEHDAGRIGKEVSFFKRFSV